MKLARLTGIIAIGAACWLAGCADIARSVAEREPTLEQLDQVAGDAAGWGSIYNHHGGHQGRITAHADGTLRVLYTQHDRFRQDRFAWRLMKRGKADGEWRLEAGGSTVNDVFLLRNPLTDEAYVVAWPDGVGSIYTLPGIRRDVFPGQWRLIDSLRTWHYGGVGIGADGTLCIKTTTEFQEVLPETLAATTEYVCGRRDPDRSEWTWGPQVRQPTGLRHGYDYLFPGAAQPGRLLATSTPNLHKDAAAMPWSRYTYTFNGIRLWSGALWADEGIAHRWLVEPRQAPAQPDGTTPPFARQQDGLIDTLHRVLAVYWMEVPGDRSVRGHWLAVSDFSGRVLHNGKLAIPAHGRLRLFEDGKQRLWLLWTASGERHSSLRLYRLTEGEAPMQPTFTLGPPTVLDDALGALALEGNVRLAVPRVGQSPGNAIDGMALACDALHTPQEDLHPDVKTRCYPKGFDRQRVIHFRIRLPD